MSHVIASASKDSCTPTAPGGRLNELAAYIDRSAIQCRYIVSVVCVGHMVYVIGVTVSYFGQGVYGVM